MKKIVFQGTECYVAYKVLFEDNSNFRGNYKYITNKWYSSFDVGESIDVKNTYGMNLFSTIERSIKFCNIGIVYECYIPIKNNKLTFVKVENSGRLRCQHFYMTDKKFNIEQNINFKKMSIKLQKETLMFNKINVDKYWNKLTEHQKDLSCKFQKINADKYWNKLTEHQKDLSCRYQKLDIDKHWNKLTENQKDLSCINQKINVDKHLDKLTEYQEFNTCVYQELDVEKYLPKVNKKHIITLLTYQKFNFDKYLTKLTEFQKDSIYQCNKFFVYNDMCIENVFERDLIIRNYKRNKIYSSNSLIENIDLIKKDTNKLDLPK